VAIDSALPHGSRDVLFISLFYALFPQHYEIFRYIFDQSFSELSALNCAILSLYEFVLAFR